MSAHNEKIKNIYGNFNFWSWFRYWYVDSVNFVTMMLLDKGYYDYDAEKVESKVRWEDTVKSDEEVANLLSMFGMGPKAQKPKNEEEVQNYLLKHFKED